MNISLFQYWIFVKFCLFNSRLNWCIFQLMRIYNECKSYIIPLRIFLIIKSYPWKMNNNCTLNFFLPLRLNRLSQWVEFSPWHHIYLELSFILRQHIESWYSINQNVVFIKNYNGFLWIWLLMKITLMLNMSMQK